MRQDPSREFILSTAEGFRTSFRLPILDWGKFRWTKTHSNYDMELLIDPCF